MSTHEMPTGGRTGARRTFAAVALVLCGISQVARTSASVEPDPPLDVSVRQDRGVYTVSARFDVPQSAPTAFAVLTDYEQIPRFMPDVKTSIVRERFPGGVIVEQEAVARIMMFSKRVHLLLEVHAAGDVVRFRDSSGRSFARYEGTWQLTPHDGRTVINYDLSAEPAFDVPAFLLTRLLKRDAHQMIDRLRVEIAARAR